MRHAENEMACLDIIKGFLDLQNYSKASVASPTPAAN